MDFTPKAKASDEVIKIEYMSVSHKIYEHNT